MDDIIKEIMELIKKNTDLISKQTKVIIGLQNRIAELEKKTAGR